MAEKQVTLHKIIKMEHTVETSFVRDRVFSSVIDDHVLVMDSPEDGPSAGPSPKKMMLASLAACTGIDVVSILAKMKVDHTHFTISTRAMLTEDHPKIYSSVYIIYSIRVAKEDELKVRKAVDLSVEKYCGVMAMFEKFAKVDIEIKYT